MKDLRLGILSGDPAQAERLRAALGSAGEEGARVLGAVPGEAVWDALLVACPEGSESLLASAAAGPLSDRPVVFALLSSEDLPQVERCFALGADDVFSDRLNPALLVMRLRKHLEDRATLAKLEALNERSGRLFLNIVKVMVKVLETKDEYTKFHSDNVAKYSRMIAARMGLPKDDVYHAGLAGILHDFGKIGVAEKILNKPSRLTEQEFAVIKRHPSIGSLILESISGLERVIPGIKYHHERFDGRGYPEGLKGEEIPVLGRIVGIADAFDTLTSERTYHRRVSKEEAILEMQRCAGTQFDPRVVTAFVDVLQNTSLA